MICTVYANFGTTPEPFTAINYSMLPNLSHVPPSTIAWYGKVERVVLPARPGSDGGRSDCKPEAASGSV